MSDERQLRVRLREINVAAMDRRLTSVERDERRAIHRRLYPWMEFSPSTEEMGRRFGHRSKREEKR